MNPKYSKIVEREFRLSAKIPDSQPISVEFNEKEETITVRTRDRGDWVMEIGSDDDYFWFRDNTGDVVRFDFPDDWIELEENGPW